MKALMLKMGVHHCFVDLIMARISSVSYSVLVNKVSSGYIKPSRGIKQRDPISPHLFLLCSEGIFALLRHAAQQRQLHGVSISWNGPQLTHLLFVDNSFLFYQASLYKCNIIKEILQTYESASGQKINCDKN